MQQQSIEENAITTYTKNLTYFQKEHPEVYEKISALNAAIENGHYQEKYELQYKDEGYFDVYESATKHYLYGSSSLEHANLAAQSIDYKKYGNLFETFYDVEISEEDAASYDDVPIVASQYSASAHIINYHNRYASQDKTTMKKIYKFIFFGTGLGFHITAIHKKIQANVYFIVEDDLELFRLSLFTTDYEELSANGTKLYFSVFDDADSFHKHAGEFLQEMFIYNHFLKFFHILSHDESKIKEFQKAVLSQGYLVFNYSPLTSGILRPLVHLKEGYNILDVSHPYNNVYLNTKPVLILGAGPSIQRNLEWIKENQDKFIIVAVSALLSMMEEHNIKPNIITHVHGFDDAMPHVQKVKDMSFFDESIALFSSFATPEFVSYFKKENVFLFQGTSEFKKKFSSFSSSNVGALTHGLLLRLGVKNSYLLGLDFALDPKTGQSHANAHAYSKKMNIDKTDYKVEDSLSYSDSVITTKGNFRESVNTMLIFNSFRIQCNLLTRLYADENNKIYNLSDGALLEQTIPLHTEDIQLKESLDKTEIYKSLHQTFMQNSENFLTDEDLEGIYTKLAYIRKIKSIVQSYAKRKYSNIDDFHYYLLDLYQDILSEEYSDDALELNNVITMYIQYVSGFIFDLINTKELTNPKRHIKQINKIATQALLKLIRYYDDFLTDFLEDIGKPYKG